MMAMAAHEFNNILTPIISYAQLARKNPALVQKAIARAADGGLRASNICRAILDMTCKTNNEPSETNLAELVPETLAVMARDPGKDSIELVFQAPGDLTIITRRAELQQVILNLVMNARAAVMEKEGPRTIGISIERQGRDVVLSVADNGVGIPPENIERIFEPFFTTKNSPEGESCGYGLGLAICREIVTEEMGGQIAVESTPGKGTTFTVRLPA